MSNSLSEVSYTPPKVSKKNWVLIHEFILKFLESDIENYFKTIGELIDVAVMRDKNSGRSRGFAFVTFVVYPTQLEIDKAQQNKKQPE